MLKIRCQNCNLYYDGDSNPVCPYCVNSSGVNVKSEINVLKDDKTIEKKGLKSIFLGFSKKSQSSQTRGNIQESDQNKPSTTFQGSISFSDQTHSGCPNQTNSNAINQTYGLSDNMPACDKTRKLSDVLTNEETDIYSFSSDEKQNLQKNDELNIDLNSAKSDSQSELSNNLIKQDVESKSLREEIDSSVNTDKTIGVIRTVADSSPVVGWLVGLKGVYQGESFEIHQGKNHIGRALNMSIALVKEKTVSRDKHATIIFDPENFILSQEKVMR